jgi:hypothetical protein
MKQQILGLLAIVPAVAAEFVIRDAAVGLLVAIAIYLPLHNRIWGRV